MAESAYKWYQRKGNENRADRAEEARAFRNAAATNEPSGYGANATPGGFGAESIEANRPSGPSRSFGFRSGAAPAGGMANQRLGEAVEAGKSLGEPTSFRGGAGAPAPVGVIRGMRQTFATDTGGPQMAEFASKEQAGQAWNRARAGEAKAAVPTQPTPGAMGGFRAGTSPEDIQARNAAIDAQYGTWRPEGATKAEIVGEQARLTDAADPYKAAAAGKLKAETDLGAQQLDEGQRKKVITEFDSMMHESPYSTFDTKSKRTVFQAKDEAQYRDYLDAKNQAVQQGNAAAGRQRFEDRQMVRQWLQTQRLQPGTNIDALIDAGTRNPKTWQGLVEDARRVMKVSQPGKPVPPVSWYDAQSEGIAKGFMGP